MTVKYIPMEHLKSLGRKIGEIRRIKGITQEKLAEKADLTVSYISKIETGKKNPTISTINKISLGLDVEIYQLFLFDGIIDLQRDDELTIDEVWKECDKKKRKKLLAIINAMLDL